MNDLEKMIWAAAYAAAFEAERRFLNSHGKTVDDVSGYACAEIADVALAAYWEEIKSDDGGYLTPTSKGWV